MKKSDIMVVIFIAAAGVIIAYFLCGALMEDIQPVTFKTVGAVSAQLDEPDPEVFNSAALNPTVETYVGSCIDPDQDGELDLAESVLCQDRVPEVNDAEENAAEETGENEENGTGANTLQEILEQINESNAEDGSENGATE